MASRTESNALNSKTAKYTHFHAASDTLAAPAGRRPPKAPHSPADAPSVVLLRPLPRFAMIHTMSAAFRPCRSDAPRKRSPGNPNTQERPDPAGPPARPAAP
jgi:hypothetical protein